MEEQGDRLLSTADAAARLGVKRETLYAYVSRGLLTRRARPPGRQSWFALADIERLLRERGNRAQLPPEGPGSGVVPTRAPELEIVSSITAIDAGRLRYRGYDLDDLLGRRSTPRVSFEAVAELLWTGVLPSDEPRWAAAPALLEATRTVLGAAPPTATLADRLRIATAAAAAADPLRVDLRPAAVMATARSLLVVLADALVESLADSLGPSPAEPVAASASSASSAGSVAERVATALGVTPRWVDAIDTALVVLADHELATSTLAARVAASTRADPYQVVLAGMAAVSGPLHGSASARVGRLLRTAGEPGGPEAAIASELRELGAVAGFGQGQYPDGDPRAPLLLAAARAAAGPTGEGAEVIERAAAVEAAVARRAAIAPNVDFGLATLVAAAGLSLEVGEALFALARTAGWVAHGLEEYAAPPLRYRLRAVPANPAVRRADG